MACGTSTRSGLLASLRRSEPVALSYDADMTQPAARVLCSECDRSITNDPSLPISSLGDNLFVAARVWPRISEPQPDVAVCGACAANIVRQRLQRLHSRQGTTTAGAVCAECHKTVTNDPDLAISSFKDHLFCADRTPAGGGTAPQRDVAICGACAVWIVRLHFARTDTWWGTMAKTDADQTPPEDAVIRGGPMMTGTVDEAYERLEWLTAHPDDEYWLAPSVVALCRRIFECWPADRPVPFFCPTGNHDGSMDIDDDERSASIRVTPASVALVTGDWTTDAHSEQYTALGEATLRRVLPAWLDIIDNSETFTDWHARQPDTSRSDDHRHG